MRRVREVATGCRTHYTRLHGQRAASGRAARADSGRLARSAMGHV